MRQADLFDAPAPEVLTGELVPAPASDRPQLEPSASATTGEPVNAATVYLASLQPGTSRYTMRHALGQLAETLSGHPIDPEQFPWGTVRYVHAAWLRAQLVNDGYAPATSKKILAALRRVIREAFRLGQTPPDEYHRLMTLEPVSGSSPPVGRALGAGELRALVEHCATDPLRGRRDTALLAVMYQGGLRRAEASSLNIENYDDATGTLTVVHGKGKKARLVYLDGGAAHAIREWIAERAATSGPLFVHLPHKNPPARLGVDGVHGVVISRAHAAGLAHFSAHSLRRSALSDLLDSGVDLATVQRYAGHASPSTTSLYDRRGERTKREAASKLHFPTSR